MKKLFFILMTAMFLASCGNKLEEVTKDYEQVRVEKTEKTEKTNEKQDPNFRIFNDHFQKGK